MTEKPTVPRPTHAELEILQVLWRLGPSTVRAVHGQIAGRRDTGYTTTLKLLQIMAGKGLVQRDRSERSHVYKAAISQDRTQHRLVRDLLRTAFSGSAHKLVLHALSSKRATPDELRAIREVLKDMERDKP